MIKHEGNYEIKAKLASRLWNKNKIFVNVKTRKKRNKMCSYFYASLLLITLF